MGRIGVERTIEIMKALLAGEDPKVRNADEKRVKDSLDKDVKLAEKEGYQLDLPNV